MLLAWRTESSRDFGYHLATGRWILEHRSWPTVDSFTYTLSGRPYIDMHGLFQIALALAYRGGMIGIGLLRVAFALATFAITAPDIPNTSYRCIKLDLSGRPVSLVGTCPP